ncbi:4-hydroxythreonine-4-phosphate dehydrogenase PdxA [Pelagibacterium montanilacus]|uniref:4-hydroxythreonine-4-phosphate dehydrogenase PdxA n=1 Tax=Pelagibacterium montanilacus TaxID=2185280 RepID=UPI000F8E9228|nr:4-hydroxythreonine-4-phosphate dehydrogenase PdxA [Pelagibacterium montanilacus]
MSGTAPLALSMGEPAGVGPDVIVSIYARRREIALSPFAVYGSAALLASRARRLGLDIAIQEATPETAVGIFDRALPVVPIEAEVDDNPGMLSEASAPLVIGAIKKAAADVMAGSARGLVTAPIHKAVLYAAGFAYPGHTEFLAALCEADGETPLPVMMLAHEGHRVVPLTIHVPLASVPGLITADAILRTARIVARDLAERFGIEKPRLAIAGLNPHAGEDGMIGREELEIIGPAIAALRAEGIAADGPHSADTIFHPPHWRQFDAVIAMYHDQALIPIKTLAFDSGVNVTLGLPFVRTSPDHGTALELAGTGKASDASMLAAIRLADRMA